MEALKPARVLGAVVDEENKSAIAIVNDDSFSLAIGRRGVNVRLAVKLTGYNIDVKTETTAVEEGLTYVSLEEATAEENAKKAEQIMLKRQKELQVAMEQGISFREDAKRLLGNAERELIQPLEAKLDSVLHLIGKENGLLFIGNSDGHNFPFIHNESGLDITEVVLARLNGTVIPINTATRVKSDTTTEPAPEGQTTTTPLSKEAENAKVSEILKSN